MYPLAFPGKAGHLGSIPGSGRSPGEGNGYPHQYSFLENSIDRGAWQATPWGHQESDTTEQLTLSLWLLILDNPHKHASCLTEGRKESDTTEQLN